MGQFDAQGGNTEADDKATELIGELFHSEQPGSMVMQFVLIVKSIDEEGDEVISTFTSQGLKRWDSMGMLSFALQCENGNTHLNTDVDEDD
jgi:hypothetical protein